MKEKGACYLVDEVSEAVRRAICKKFKTNRREFCVDRRGSESVFKLGGERVIVVIARAEE